jgi:hypothetical protein
VVPNQWKASATNAASTDRSASGMRSAVPVSASKPGSRRRSSESIAGEASTAITRPTSATNSRVSLPVPAARSSTALAEFKPSSRTSSSTTPGG